MTQPFTSDDRLLAAQLSPAQGRFAEDNAERASHYPDNAQPAIVHPNFDPSQKPIDPARPLSDIPEPTRQVNVQLRRLYGKSARFYQHKEATLSKWKLIASGALAEHLDFLRAAKLIDIPDSFYHPYQGQNAQSLLSSLESMSVIDMADIQAVIDEYPTLTRYGFSGSQCKHKQCKNKNSRKQQGEQDHNYPATFRELSNRHNPDELLNSLYADDWQVILQPEQFDTGIGSLATDIMACSVAVHALKQCATRKSINNRYSAADICQYVRSYLLSQIGFVPAQRYQYRQIRLFTGHIIVAAAYLGWEMQISEHGDCYFNLSSRCSLLTRYPNMQSYYINGWSG